MSATALVRAALAADLPVLLWGPPGTGKTASVLAMARAAGAHVEVLIGSSVDPVDLAGREIPTTDGRLVCAPPPWAARLRAALDAGRPAWLVLDELSTAPPSVQAALLRLVHERRVGDVDLRGVRVIGAANRADTAADGGWLAPAAANRWVHLDWTVDVPGWVSGELRGWGSPRSAGHAAAAASICGYLQRHPAALLGTPSGEAYPSPRSWSAAAALLAAVGGPRSTLALSAVGGCVGVAAATEWAEWTASQDLPDPEDLLAGRATWPSRGDQCLAAGSALVAAAASDHPERSARLARSAELVAALRPDVAAPVAALLLDALDGEVPDPLLGIADAIRGARRRLQ